MLGDKRGAPSTTLALGLPTGQGLDYVPRLLAESHAARGKTDAVAFNHMTWAAAAATAGDFGTVRPQGLHGKNRASSRALHSNVFI